MSLVGIAATSFFSGAIAQSSHNKLKAQQEFQQIGQDIRAGNLAQAQTDLATLQKDFPRIQPSSTNSPQNPAATIPQVLQKLSQDLGTGNLSAAQTDFSNLQISTQQIAGRVPHHHHPHGATSDATPTSSPDITQLFSQLGQALQSGNIASAQQSYAGLLQDFQQYISSSAAGTSALAPGAVSVSA